MVELRPIGPEDIAAIKNWPAYADGFEQMDYALREHGWLDEYQQQPNTWIFIAELNHQTIGFSLLSITSETVAEYRIAMHPYWTGKGLGKPVTRATLKIGFGKLNLDTIHLIVRKNNHPATKLYERLGFVITGESIRTIQGQCIEFTDMAMIKDEYNKINTSEC